MLPPERKTIDLKFSRFLTGTETFSKKAEVKTSKNANYPKRKKRDCLCDRQGAYGSTVGPGV